MAPANPCARAAPADHPTARARWGSFCLAWSRSSEKTLRFLKSFRERLHLGARVVEAERGPAGRCQPEPRKKRLGAMGSGADGDAQTVEDGGDIVRVRAFHRKRDDRALLRRMPDEAERVYGLQQLLGIASEMGFMRANAVLADAVHVIQRGGERRSFRDRRCARLETVRRIVIARARYRTLRFRSSRRRPDKE